MALLGCIADDFTGGTDLAGMLAKHGMRTVQMIGVPQIAAPDAIDAIVVALKSRTIAAREAVGESLSALKWLRDAGCRQFYFKYCSTFDSTDKGNIGPVIDALMTALGSTFTIACPAFPENKRTIFKGYLFAGDVLLNESGMQNHPLTPMTDPNLVRVLQRQTKRNVGLVDYQTVGRGAEKLKARFKELQDQAVEIAIVDATSNDDLLSIGAACADLPLVTAGSGVGLGLPQNFRGRGLLPDTRSADCLPRTGGLRAVIAGSCSTATNAQVAAMGQRHPAFNVNPAALAGGEDVVNAALEWASTRVTKEPVLVYATATPEQVKATQAQFGTERAGAMVEDALAKIAKGLVSLGVGQLIVAGGETSGAIVKALGIKGLQIGPEIDPGVPWTATLGSDRTIALALKSGNFGTSDFFLKAWSRIP